MKMFFDVILAQDRVGGIGCHNITEDRFYIPWTIPEDLQHFKNITCYTENPFKQNVVIMGYNTWMSLPTKYKPLPSRINIVITKRLIEGIDTYKSFQEALVNLKTAKYCDIINNVFVVGGAMLYEEALRHPNLRYIYLTTIDSDCGCTIKVNIDKNKYKLLNTYTHKVNDVDVTFSKYDGTHEEYQYLNSMSKILDNGSIKDARNGDTVSFFGDRMVFDLSNNVVPILTTKKIFIRAVFEELLFFLRGDTNTNKLKEKNVNIWNGNTSRAFLDSVGLHHLKEGDIGPLYGFQWRHYGAEYFGFDHDYTGKGVDQLANLIDGLIKNRHSRRLLLTTYNPAQINQGPLPPCHGIAVQFGVENDNELCCQMYQR